MLQPLTRDDPLGIGPYRLLARLGHGGMGTVYLARSAGGRTVALKTMHAHIASDTAARTRFHLEADAARIIGGHHGATVVDADPAAETPWLATEYVLGPPLDDAVALSGPLPEASVRALGAALAGALAQLHASDVVHRDLKPSNVMITAYGPKIIDFGIARAAGDDRLTRTGTAAGTPAFMSPEQATGQEHTPAGDVFALAGVLTYAATGHGPFGTGQAADLLYRVRYADADLTGLPHALIPILAACLAKDPAHRPTTHELATQLHSGHGHFADHLPDALLADIARRATEVWAWHPHRLPAPAEQAYGGTDTSPASTGPTRRRLLTIGGSGVVGAAVAATGLWTWLGQGGSGSGKKPDAEAKPGRTATKKGNWLWRLPLSAPKNAPAAPVPLGLVGTIALADDNGVRVIDMNRGGVEIPSLGTAPAHRCIADSNSSRLYICEPVSSGDGPLTVKVTDFTSEDLNPDLVEFKDYNGGLAGTQLLCAEEGVVYLAAGQGKHSGEAMGYGDGQTWFLMAVDSHTLKVVWRQPLPARPHTSQRLHFLAARVTEKGHLVLLQEKTDGTVTLVVRNSRTGETRWEKALDVTTPDDVRGMLEVDLIHVYPPTGPLRALSLQDGKEVWNFGVGRSRRRTGPPAVGDSVFVVEEGLGLVALDFVTGDLVWREKGAQGRQSDLTVPPVAGYKYVYSYDSKAGRMRAVDVSTGQVAKTYEAEGERFFPYLGIPERLIAVGRDFVAGYDIG
ncbi:outer membrane protein assembly factor BamB [Streptomyces sp. V4I23]|uniref:serine/threonine-protein kinase n=1 Tax=Streptomyces sp. V4I23 TaxID=3042282 RepID=UPI00278AE05C|nr:serine/threonine-protein kinase [Streptomyces sp. V4I23]MDQ1010500.1 outer membrane protein assembly factor BamB [Streptomyces sp. V4I23]